MARASRKIYRLILFACLYLAFQGTAFSKTISGITVTPLDAAAGAASIYEVALTPGVNILNNDRLVFDFPVGFDASQVIVASAVSGMDGGLQVTNATASQVILTRDGTGTTSLAGAAVTVRFGNVQNSNTAGNAYSLTVTLQSNAGATKDGPNVSSLFSIASGSLDHFLVEASAGGNIAGQTAGSAFTIRITAQDAFNNTVTGFTGTATLSDATGSLSPTTSSNFSAGVLASQSVTITQATASTSINAISAAASGTSNAFAVSAAALDHFILSAIGSPQTAGTGFAVTITARDAFGNTATGFAGVVSLGLSSGSLTPTTSGVFSGGVRTESVTVLTTGSGVTLSVDDGASHTGVSNAFTVGAGALDHFKVERVGSGNILGQVAGAPFSIRITAQDANSNTVTDFTGSVSLADAGGTLTPGTSGSFSAGVLVSQSVTITGAMPGDWITATSGNIRSDSNIFDVAPAALDHFRLSSISSPQTAGVGFAVTVQAEDVFNNVVTGYAGTVTFSVNGGSVSPVVSGAFANGLRIESVRVLTAGVGHVLSVDDGANHIGSSNPFSVNAAALDHFQITATNGGNIANQVVGVPFDIRIVAQDVYNNTVTSFVGPVVLSDATGTIFPASSGAFTAGVLSSQSVLIGSATANVTITASSGDKSGTSNSFSVLAGSIHHILLRTQPNNGGEEFGNYNMTADDSLTLHAASYDIGNSYLGDVSVTWSSSGGLAPPVSATGASFTFKPTTASATGTTGNIIGTHATAGSDATGTITVKPGVPSGTPVLDATPPALPADGASISLITSSVVTDGDGNAVGPGRQFTVIPPSLGSIPPGQDVNPGLSGLQVQTGAGSRLNFQFLAGTAGGSTIVSVASVNGSATGSVPITIGSINITSLVGPLYVSQGQNGVQVTMSVENIGSSAIQLTSASLRFTGANGADRGADYLNIVRLDTISVVPGGESRTLQFSIDASALATIDTVDVDGVVNGTINGSPVSDNAADNPARWVVQKKANLTVQTVVAPDTVAQGQTGINVSVVAANNLGVFQSARAIIDSVVLVFKKGAQDVSTQYITTPLAGNADTLDSGLAATFQFTVNVSAAADTGAITIDARAYGRDQNSNQTIADTDGADVADSWLVSPAATLRIVSITPSQPGVTQGMTKPWIAKMAIANNSSSNIQLTLDDTKTYIRFFRGSDNVSGEYSIVQPTELKGGGTILGPTTTDTLEFVITQTGTTTGTIFIAGRVEGIDVGPGLIVSDDTNDGGKGQVSVQSPANLVISGIDLSQQTATAGQTQPWFVLVNLQNTGSADIRLAFNRDSTFIGLSDTLGYDITAPDTLSGASPGTILQGNSTAILAYRVDTTGATLGINTINATVSGYEINTGRFTGDATNAGNSTTFVVQTPPLISIAETFVDPVSAPNAPNVNVRQGFLISVKIQNTGQEQADSVAVSISGDGTSQIGQRTPVFAKVPGGAEAIVSFPIAAADIAGAELFSALLDSAIGKNTGLPVQIASPVDDSVRVAIQDSAGLKIREVATSDTSVFANQFTPWDIYVVVQDTGGAGLAFESPKVSDITIKMNGQERTDFQIVAPTRLKNNPGLTLGGGQIDTLVYTVTRTGTDGGQAQIFAGVRATDLNDGHAMTAADSGEIFIETSAAVQITDTSPVVFNLQNQPEIGFVNTGQVYRVKVTVENPGLEPVSEVVVQLQTDGTALIQSILDTIPAIPAQGSGSLEFSVTAPVQANLPGEHFNSEILKATASQSGNPARIRPPFPGADVTTVITQRAAELSLGGNVSAPDGKLSVGQRFTLSSLVQNLGDADVDDTGRLTLFAPPGYQVDEALQRPFQVSTALVWNITAPAAPSGPDTFIVQISHFPKDKNIDAAAAFARAFDTLIVETDTTQLAVQAFVVDSPPGAQDNVLSNGQLFTVKATVSRSANLPDIRGTLHLPTGYAFQRGDADSAKTLGAGQSSLVWEILAPANPTNRADDLIVRFSGSGGQGQQQVAYDTLAVTTVLQAQLQVQASIISPPGAENGNLAMGQKFILRAFLLNAGDAQTEGIAKLTLDLGNTGVSTDEPLEKDIVVEQFVDWVLQAPAVQATQKPLTVTITQTPLDENTNNPAVRTKHSGVVFITTRDVGSISAANLKITNPVGATDKVLSTDQRFTVGTTVSWQDATDLEAEIFLPTGFSVEDKIQQPGNAEASGNEFMTWNIAAPTSRQSGAAIFVQIRGRDAADTTKITALTDTIFVDVVNKASLVLSAQISSPPSALDGILSADQLFAVQAVVNNQGDANVFGSDSIRIVLPTGYTTSEQLVKSTTGGIAAWELRSPPNAHEEPRLIRFQVIANPRDENSEEIVQIAPPETTVPIRTEVSKLLVAQVNIQGSPNAIMGQKDVALLRVAFVNQGGAGSSNLLLQELVLDVLNYDGSPISAAEIISQLQVKRLSDGAVFYQSSSIASTSKLQIAFAQDAILVPQVPDTFAIVVDISETANQNGFKVRLDRNNSILAIDADSRQTIVYEMVDANGNSGDIESDPLVILDQDVAKNFHNYPNPFGTPDKAQTVFTYSLEDDSDVVLKLYTLFGELVWQATFSASDPQGRASTGPKSIVWDGLNGTGKRVLNGVYLAILTTNAGSVTTKVAVLR